MYDYLLMLSAYGVYGAWRFYFALKLISSMWKERTANLWLFHNSHNQLNRFVSE
jgi:hypothetical protein